MSLKWKGIANDQLKRPVYLQTLNSSTSPLRARFRRREDILPVFYSLQPCLDLPPHHRDLKQVNPLTEQLYNKKIATHHFLICWATTFVVRTIRLILTMSSSTSTPTPVPAPKTVPVTPKPEPIKEKSPVPVVPPPKEEVEEQDDERVSTSLRIAWQQGCNFDSN